MAALAAAAFSTPDGPVDARLDALRRAPRRGFAGSLLFANNAALLYQMTVKPGLAGSLLAIAVAHAGMLLVGRLPRLRPAAGTPVLAADH